MFWQRLFARKSLEMLHAEMEGENRLKRVLGPIGLTSLGIGAIIGSGIFVASGEAAANPPGPPIPGVGVGVGRPGSSGGVGRASGDGNGVSLLALAVGPHAATRSIATASKRALMREAY